MARERRSDAGRSDATEVPVDVYDRGAEYVVTADLPGYRTRDIDVSAHKNRVTIAAARAGDGQKRGPVRRVVTLPRWVDGTHADARYHNGVLRVTLPKTKRGQ